MKKTILILVSIFIFGCSSKEQSLVGKWEKTEEYNGGGLGDKVVITKVKNSKTYTFKEDNKLTLIADGLNYEGVYEIVEDKNHDILHTITFAQIGNETFDSYFRIQFTDSITKKKIALTPVHPDNQIMYSYCRVAIYKKTE